MFSMSILYNWQDPEARDANTLSKAAKIVNGLSHQNIDTLIRKIL